MRVRRCVRLIAGFVFTWLAACPSSLLLAKGPEESKRRKPQASSRKASHEIPTWAADARWYHVVVSRFHNGDRGNDTAQHGGDLAGLAKRLSYFSELRVNTLYLSSLFTGDGSSNGHATDLRHVEASVGRAGDPRAAQAESSDPASWVRTPGDRLFLRFIKAAHDAKMRVIVDASFGRVKASLPEGADVHKHLFACTRRWMDPNGDGNPSDGIDGWLLQNPEKLPHEFWKRWRKLVKKLNPDALLVGDMEGDAAPWLAGDEFDVFINYDLAQAIRRFFDLNAKHRSLKTFLADIRNASTRYDDERQLASPITLSGPTIGRLLSALSLRRPGDVRESPRSTPVGELKLGIARWRLATLLQHVVPGAPMVYYGDEVGMYNTKGRAALASMWWVDRKNDGGMPKHYRADFAALTQFLHVRRERDEPLRRGAFREVMADEARGLLAFARTLPGDEVILLINFGKKKEEVHFSVGTPGQMITLLGPRLIDMKPPGAGSGKLIAPLRVGGSRRIVKPDGTIRFWINPNCVRLIFVAEKGR